MKNKNISIVFSSGVSSITEKNSSFDSGILKIAYPGVNRNKTSISKKVFENCLETLTYCPVVCRYDPVNDEIGSHDVELVKRDDGVFLINSTHPVGFVPREATQYWEDVEEEDGTIHEYLCTEVTLWKRQPAYANIKANGTTKHSMEIRIKDGEYVDGIFVIKDFEFTALCLLGTAEPCFEGSELEVFELSEFKEQYTAMMQEFKETFNLVDPSKEVDIHSDFYSEGGELALQEKIDLLKTFGLTVEQVNFDVENMTLEELKAELVAMSPEPQEPQGPSSEEGTAPTDESGEPGVGEDSGENAEPSDEDNANTDEGNDEASFALAEQFRNELIVALHAVTVDTSYGEVTRYWYVDYDPELNEVYCEDFEDWNLYGFPYSTNGDHVIIDFDCKKRKKFVIADFDEGEQLVFSKMFAMLEDRYNEVKAKYEATNAELETTKAQVTELQEFKLKVENEAAMEQREEIFGRFGSLVGVEAFENLKDNCEGISPEDLEEKCFAILGRVGAAGNYAYNPGGKPSVKLKVNKEETQPEPYGGIMSRYGITAD